MNDGQKKIVILGGGFGGVRTALDLTRRRLPGVKIQLISDQPHFEYHPALYRVVTGRSPLEVCVPLSEIFGDTIVEVIAERINKIDLVARLLIGASGSRYSFDYLVIALGSETSYFGVSGLPDFSFGFKSIGEALKLKIHLHQIFAAASKDVTQDKVVSTHLVIVGGGASGVELAGELAVYSKILARKHSLDPLLITIDLIELAPRVLPGMSPAISAKVKARLHDLGVNIFLNRTLVREELSAIQLKDMAIQTKTVIWTAGVKTNALLAGISGLQFDKRGRVVVDKTLRPAGFSSVFVIGDSAATIYSGMAQTAITDGCYVAQAIRLILSGRRPPAYKPKRPFYSIPVGPGWAATTLGPLTLYGRLGWFFRRYADFGFFCSILSFRKALLAFASAKVLSESCPVCNPAGQLEFK